MKAESTGAITAMLAKFQKNHKIPHLGFPGNIPSCLFLPLISL